MTKVRTLPADESFSLRGYRSLISTASECGYQFLTFAALPELRDTCGRLCLMRHDVDVNVDYALELARLEAAAGVPATYFVMLRSPAYNLLGRAASLAVREIVSLGHEIGVHFDAHHPLVSEGELVSNVLKEASIVAELAHAPVSAVSFHQPSRKILNEDIDIPGLVNSYNRRQLAGWHYISDSNRNWRGPSAWDQLRTGSHARLQILTHPMWWVSEGLSTQEVWDSALCDNFETMQRQFLDTEAAYGAPRSICLKRTPEDPRK